MFLNRREVLPRAPRLVECAVAECLDEPADQRERRAQLVRDVGDELLAKLLVTRGLGDVARDDYEPCGAQRESTRSDLELLAVAVREGDRLALAGERDFRDCTENLLDGKDVPQGF